MAKGLRLWIGMHKDGICVMGREDPEIPEDKILLEDEKRVGVMLGTMNGRYWDVEKQEWRNLFEE